jgi:hypothetical protein
MESRVLDMLTQVCVKQKRSKVQELVVSPHNIRFGYIRVRS